MKEIYEPVQMDIIEFENEDVIITSNRTELALFEEETE